MIRYSGYGRGPEITGVNVGGGSVGGLRAAVWRRCVLRGVFQFDIMFNDSRKQLPFLTAELPGIGGRIKVRCEDFVVDEIPLYEASGEGTHVYVRIEKRLFSTPAVVARMAKELKAARSRIGYAGLKDARAVTRQWMSIEHVDAEQVAGLAIPGVKVLEVSRHGNKLKIGHHRGNRFSIKVRHFEGVVGQARERAEAIMAVLTRRGAPNYFGPQRFGNRYDAHLLGGHIARGEHEEFIDLLLGQPDANHEKSVIYAARLCYENGDYEKAHEAWPTEYHEQRRALRALVKNDGNKKRAYNVIDRRTKRFFISAFQADVFNDVVVARLGQLDRLLGGDMAWKHDSGACFLVEDPEVEQGRCGAFEISPSGPLVGPRTAAARGEAGQIEQEVIDRAGLSSEVFRQLTAYRSRGSRRPLRFRPRNVQIGAGQDDYNEYVQLEFETDPGCYATTVLREVTKSLEPMG